MLRFKLDRDRYWKRLREAVREGEVSFLGCNITSNHVHLVAYAEAAEAIGRILQQAAGELARD